jgi:hypothetical protein
MAVAPPSVSLRPAIIGPAGYRYWIVAQRHTEIDSHQTASRCGSHHFECGSLQGGGPRSRCFGGAAAPDGAPTPSPISALATRPTSPADEASLFNPAESDVSLLGNDLSNDAAVFECETRLLSARRRPSNVIVLYQPALTSTLRRCRLVMPTKSLSQVKGRGRYARLFFDKSNT